MRESVSDLLLFSPFRSQFIISHVDQLKLLCDAQCLLRGHTRSLLSTCGFDPESCEDLAVERIDRGDEILCMILSSEVYDRSLNTRLIQGRNDELPSQEGILGLYHIDLSSDHSLDGDGLTHREECLLQAVVCICHQHTQFTDLFCHGDTVQHRILRLFVFPHQLRRDDAASGRDGFP